MVLWKCIFCNLWNEAGNQHCVHCGRLSRHSVQQVNQYYQMHGNDDMMVEESVTQIPPRLAIENSGAHVPAFDEPTTSATTNSTEIPAIVERQDSRIDLIHKQIDEAEAAETLNRILTEFRLTGQPFTDPDFPPDNKSLFFLNSSDRSSSYRFNWNRPSNIHCSRDCMSLEWVVVRQPTAADIEQGTLGNCWFLSALAVVAEQPKLIDKILVTKKYQPSGVYQVQLCHGGQWVTVTVDDWFPCDQHGFLIYSQARRKQLWVPLIEKAAAKLHGCYEALIAGHTVESLNMLTGAPCETLVIGDFDQDMLWAQLLSCHQQKFLMGASSGSGIATRDGEPRDEEYTQKGLKKKHAYSILDIQDACGNLLVQLKNPWARTSWNGDWSSESSLWDLIPAQQQQRLKVRESEEGVFWMCIADFMRYFTSVDVCRLRSADWSEVRLSCHLPSLRIFSSNEPAPFGDRRGQTSGYSHQRIATSVKVAIITVYQNTEMEIVIQQAPVRQSSSLSLVDLGLLIFRGNVLDCQSPPILVGHTRRAIRLVNSLHQILEPDIYSIVRYSFATWHNTGPPIDSVVTIHSRGNIDLMQDKLSEEVLRNSIISLVVAKGTEHSGRKGMTAYYLTKGWCGMFLVVENRMQSMHLHVECDCSESQNVVSSRGSLITRDSVPPLSRQLIIVLTQLETYQRFIVTHRLQHRNSLHSELGDWGHSRDERHNPSLEGVLHDSLPL